MKNKLESAVGCYREQAVQEGHTVGVAGCSWSHMLCFAVTLCPLSPGPAHGFTSLLQKAAPPFLLSANYRIASSTLVRQTRVCFTSCPKKPRTLVSDSGLLDVALGQLH